MTTIQRISFATVVLAFVVACGSTDEPAPPPVEETAFGDMVGTMDKARAVQDTSLQHKDDLDRAINESEGADAP